MFGFSAGGFTTLVAIGGTPDMRTVAPYCAAHPDEWSCRMLREHKVNLSANSSMAAPNWVHDPRIVAAVIASPAVGYAFSAEALSAVTVPIQLWRGDSDEILPQPSYAQAVYDRLPVKPEYHVVPNAGHFAFLAPCSLALAARVPEICHDPVGFDRTAFHREFNPAVVAFFKAKIPAEGRDVTITYPAFNRQIQLAIVDFRVGPKRPIRDVRSYFANGGKADVTRTSQFGSD
jgi:predicted dienelactone hydrolase